MVYRLSFDRKTGQYSSSSDDITVSVPGFGLTETVETLSRGLILTFPYYFVERRYERGKSIRAAPYDWRVGPGMLLDNNNYCNSYFCPIIVCIHVMS